MFPILFRILYIFLYTDFIPSKHMLNMYHICRYSSICLKIAFNFTYQKKTKETRIRNMMMTYVYLLYPFTEEGNHKCTYITFVHIHNKIDTYTKGKLYFNGNILFPFFPIETFAPAPHTVCSEKTIYIHI